MTSFFMRHSFEPQATRFEEREAWAIEFAHSVWMEEVEDLSREQAVDAVVEGVAAQPIVLFTDTLRFDPRNPPPQRQGADQGPVAVQFDLVMDCDGAVNALGASAPHHQWRRDGNRASLIAMVTAYDEDQVSMADLSVRLRALSDEWVAGLQAAAAVANAEIAARREAMYNAVDAVLGVRHATHMAMKGAAALAHIPVGRVDSSRRLNLRMQPARLRLTDLEAKGLIPGNEAQLADTIADELVSLIHAFAVSLTRTPTTANKLLDMNEEAMRDVLLFILNANWEGLVTGESFLGNGKTDILLRWRNRDAFIGECKIWDGRSKFEAGLTQLLDYYTVWRATRVAMILFIRESKNVTAIIETARSALREHPRFVSEGVRNEEPVFRLRAQKDQQQIVTLHLIPVEIPK